MLTVVCAGIARSGERCTQSVNLGLMYCHHHNPSRPEERKRAASRAGKSKPSRELVSIKRQLQGLADDILSGKVDRSDGAVVSQILNVLLRALEQERRWRELEGIEERLEALEQAAQEVEVGHHWGT